MIAGVYFGLVVKGGLLAVNLPDPFKINSDDLATTTNQVTDDAGAVLGESEPGNHPNPLKNIYVNPFAK